MGASNIGNLRQIDIAALALFHSGEPVELNCLSERPRVKALPAAVIEKAIAKAPPGYEFEVEGVTFTVNGYYSPAIPATHIDPPEAADFEITGIWIGGVKVTDLLLNWAPGLCDELKERAMKANGS
jgi:hypothetical protein